MDYENLRNLKRMSSDREGKIRKLLDREVSDPWYTRDFEATWKDVNEGCNKLFEEVQ